MDRERPTKKQRELLSFIEGFISGYGYGPSYREIMRALDYKSVSTVASHVDGLIARGWLIKRNHSARSLEVINKADSEKATQTKRICVDYIDKKITDFRDEKREEEAELLEKARKLIVT